jgi:hypothetical protein
MAGEIRKLKFGDDFGILERGSNDVELCASGSALKHDEKCKIIDDAVVYLKSPQLTTLALDDLMEKASRGSQYFPNTPPGRLPDFYRAIVALRLYQQKSGKAPKLSAVLTILDLVEDTRNRDDDFAMIDTAVRAVLGYQLDPTETNWAQERLQAVKNADAGTKMGGSFGVKGVLAAAALGAGGYAVGGRVGAGVGLIAGLVVGSKI